MILSSSKKNLFQMFKPKKSSSRNVAISEVQISYIQIMELSSNLVIGMPVIFSNISIKNNFYSHFQSWQMISTKKNIFSF